MPRLIARLNERNNAIRNKKLKLLFNKRLRSQHGSQSYRFHSVIKSYFLKYSINNNSISSLLFVSSLSYHINST